ncbi:hypothetical protein NDK47_11450 [Brevibacillus ruminantium]|uniref:Uncharacterized protein n=1 Tax=Brevibacillus ruminantium TaxID=2950604 RepID=A0ABY4WLD1_9BACL|nr:hypothetical protein [Brevibacillus ruminantium]USG67848.1 hypothetical protein NDK47_11450 [Brevibacillus ruminantium]
MAWKEDFSIQGTNMDTELSLQNGSGIKQKWLAADVSLFINNVLGSGTKTRKNQNESHSDSIHEINIVILKGFFTLTIDKTRRPVVTKRSMVQEN